MRLIVAQLGARMHYGVPRLLHRAGRLERLYTDVCAGRGWPRLLRAIPAGWFPPGLQRLRERVVRGVPARRIVAFTSFGIEYARRKRAARTGSETTAAWLWGGRRFCELVIETGLDGAEGIYTFNSAALELLREARRRGMAGVVEQTIAPRSVERRLLAEENEQYPGWESIPPVDEHLEAYCEREAEEWSEADLILCGSNFVREQIAECGGPAERCAVVPYGVEARKEGIERGWHAGPLRVLTVGTVGLRKGAPYLLEAARRMRSRVQFRVVGPIEVERKAESKLREGVELTGPVSRDRVAEHFAWADVFLLPSLCEGSATVVYEAMAAGLPVVCTPNTGSVVREGEDGFIVPIRDVEAIVDCLSRLAGDMELRVAMGQSARGRAREFDLAGYGRRLMEALATLNGVVESSKLQD